MKKIFLILVLGIAFLTSCNKDKTVEISYKVDLTINPADVIGNFVEYLEGDFDMIPTDKVRIHLFIYNADGELVSQKEELVDDYSKIISFSEPLPEGQYTVIATSDVYTPSVDFEYWHFSGESKFDELEIEDTDYFGYDDKILGLVSADLSVTKPVTQEIRIKAATALLEFHWINLHYWNDVNEYRFCVNDKYNVVNCEGNDFSFSTAETGYFYSLQKINPYNYSNDVYGFAVMLPKDNVRYWINASNDEFTTDFGEGQTSFKMGKQYNITVQLDNLSVNISNVSQLSGSPRGDEVRDKIKVKQYIIDNPQLKQSMQEK